MLSRSEEFTLVAPAIALIVGLVVSWANFAIQRWRFRVDRLNVAIDHLSVEINSTADLATEYWLIDVTDKMSRGRAAYLESKLIGCQTRLSSLLLAIEALDGQIKTKTTWDKLPTLFDVMTGGSFSAASRQPDAARAQSVQSIGAEIVGELRTVAARRSKEWT